MQKEVWGNVVPQLNASPVKKSGSAAAVGKGKGKGKNNVAGQGKGKVEDDVNVVIENLGVESDGLVGKGEAVVYWMRMEDMRGTSCTHVFHLLAPYITPLDQQSWITTPYLSRITMHERITSRLWSFGLQRQGIGRPMIEGLGVLIFG